jgi:hypothetical protein
MQRKYLILSESSILSRPNTQAVILRSAVKTTSYNRRNFTPVYDSSVLRSCRDVIPSIHQRQHTVYSVLFLLNPLAGDLYRHARVEYGESQNENG